MKIRTRLLTLVLAVLIPSFLAAALGIAYVYQEQQHAFQQNLRETSRALALVLDKEIAKREGVLRTLAASPDIDQGNLQRFYAHAQTVGSMFDATVYLAKSDGQQVLNSRLPYGALDLPIGKRLAALQNQYGAEQTIVSNLYTGPLRKHPGFAVQVPVERHGKILYYIGMGSPVVQLQSVFQEQRLPSDWTGTVLDREGKVLARSKDWNKFVGKQVSDGFSRQFNEHPEGFYEAVSLSGEPVYAFFSRAPNSGWIFVVNVPKSAMLSTAVKATALMGSISLLLLVLAVVAALAVARSTARPIEALRLAAERLGRGEPVEVAQAGLTETVEVSLAMARAGNEINTAKAELEGRVKAAVQAAEHSQQALLQAQKLEALGRLTGGIAHDFNNVLQSLSTGLHVAHLTSTEPKVKSSLEICRRAVRRATDLISQLMAFGRIQDARLDTVDLGEQIGAMMPLLKGALRSDVVFESDIAPDLWPVTLDTLQLELAMLNLTINARDAMPSGGSLRLEASNQILAAQVGEVAAGEYVRLSVTDSGQGMDAEVLARALDPFFTTKSIGKGSGMGLAQAYGFARQAGGTLVLDSTPGKGTRATLYLPRSRVAARAHASEPPAPHRMACGERVLFVEDDPLVRDSVTPALKASGFQVMIAENGEEALAILAGGKPVDLVFSDIVMPGKVSGIDLANSIRSRMPHIHVVLATGYSDRRIALPGIRVISKPYHIADIVDAFHDELRMAGEEKAFS